MKNKGISEKKASILIQKIEEQEKFARATFPNASEFIDAYVFRATWEDIEDLVDYVHYTN